MTGHHNLEKLIFQNGSELLKESQKKDSRLLEKNWWYKKMLSWTMNNPKLKTSLFRFIDVLPSLSDDRRFLSHFNEYFKDQEMGLIASGLGRIAPSLMAKNIKKQVGQVAKMFIIGASAQEAVRVISKNWESGLAFSMDILGEATLSEKEASAYFKQYLLLMDELAKASRSWPKKALLQEDAWGPIPAVNISVKASSLFSQIKTEAWEYSKKQLKARLRPLFQKAARDFVFINLDMEQHHYKDLFLEIFKDLLMEEELKNYPHFGVVVQAYLRDSFQDLKELARFAEKRGQSLSVRLVKGAYWDSEVLLARQKNWPVPVYTLKEETDANFETCVQWLFKNPSNIKIAIGSHNIRSIACALAWRELQPKTSLEFQFLYGMGEGLAQALSKRGYCSRLYCAMGELIPGMSYLVRRLLENSANQSFIFNSFIKSEPPEKLLRPPQAHLEDDSSAGPPKAFLKPARPSAQKNERVFANHPLLDFSKKENRDKFKEALAHWKTKFPVEVPLIIEGEKIKTSQAFERKNPNQTDQTVSRSFFAQKEQAERAIQSGHSFFERWRLSPSQKRAASLRKLADLMAQREFELSALQALEVGKAWGEAQADVAEAIDFCRYYAGSYERLMQKKKTDEIAGEESYWHWEAVGLTAVIAPWNFPLAILTGMTTAPLLCGNTVLIKPAEQSSLTAYQLAKMLLESGFPKQSFAFLPGRGEEIGSYLAQHPKISIISFTGSFEVGSQIIKTAGRIADGQKNIKKHIVEMGGKNAILIDSSADLDEAIKGILDSAFGFQGQKCSAASRVIVVEDIYDNFIQRFLPAVESLAIGSSEDPSSSLGPVIDESAFKRIREFVRREKSQKLFEGSLKESGKAWLFPPVVYLADQADSALMQDELFAPILAVCKAKDWKTAIKRANHTRFGLTAGCYSRHPGHIEEFKASIEAGNVYINRACTGAIVKRHPFGGIKMSGLGSKTGGPEYLKQFLRPLVITENTMRRGFAPELFESK